MRVAIFAILGLAVGSFLTVVVYRVPRRESIVSPGSRCPSCGTPIRPFDNLPVVSWLVLRGRCRRCGQQISVEYPLTELATGGLFAAAGLLIEPLYAAALIAVFLALMVAIGLIDARHKVVPNRIVYPSLIAFGLLLLAGDLLDEGFDVLDGLVGLAAYAGPLFLLALAVPRGMGMGDVKLVALIGLVLGSLGLRYVAVAAGLGILAGGVGAIVAAIVLGYGRRQRIPFGPFLALGAIVAALAGEAVADAYLSLLA